LFWACSITAIIHGWQPWDPSSTKWLRAFDTQERVGYKIQRTAELFLKVSASPFFSFYLCY